MTLRILSLFTFVAFLAVAIWASQRESATERNERLLRQASAIWSTQLDKAATCSQGSVKWTSGSDVLCYTADKP